MPSSQRDHSRKPLSSSTPDSLRTFIAIPVSPSLLQTASGEPSELAQTMDELSMFAPAVRVTDPLKLHVTVKFLGDTDLSHIPRVLEIMSEVVATVPESEWALQGLGVFPNLSQPRVVWAGLHPSDTARQLAEVLNERLEELGFQTETRSFKPHVTLGYIKAAPPRHFAELVQRHQQTVFGEDRVTRIELMESKLLPSGSEYRTIGSKQFC